MTTAEVVLCLLSAIAVYFVRRRQAEVSVLRVFAAVARAQTSRVLMQRNDILRVFDVVAFRQPSPNKQRRLPPLHTCVHCTRVARSRSLILALQRLTSPRAVPARAGDCAIESVVYNEAGAAGLSFPTYDCFERICAKLSPLGTALRTRVLFLGTVSNGRAYFDLKEWCLFQNVLDTDCEFRGTNY